MSTTLIFDTSNDRWVSVERVVTFDDVVLSYARNARGPWVRVDATNGTKVVYYYLELREQEAMLKAEPHINTTLDTILRMAPHAKI